MSRWKWALIVVAIVLAGVIGWRLVSQRQDAAGRGAGAADAPVPVTVVAVEQKDVPVYLNALGTVQALNTVTVTAQVSGQLKSINFKEGQEVKKGDLIAEIDPRTFQSALDQAPAKKNQDEAQLSAFAQHARALRRLDQAAFRRRAGSRKPAPAGAPAGSAGRGRRRRDREREDAARLHAHHRTDRRHGRHPPGRCRQFGHRERRHRHRRADPSASDQRDLQPAGAGSATWCARAGRRVRSAAGQPHSIATTATRSRTACSRSSTTRSTRPPARSSSRRNSPTTKNTLWPGQFVNVRVQVKHRRRTGSWCRRPRCSAARTGVMCICCRPTTRSRCSRCSSAARPATTRARSTSGLKCRRQGRHRRPVPAQARQQGATARARRSAADQSPSSTSSKLKKAGAETVAVAATWRRWMS